MSGLDAALAACRAVQYASLMFLFGSGAFLRWLTPAALAQDIRPGLRGAARTAIVLTLISTVAWLLLQTGEIGGGWPSACDPGMLSAVLGQTGFGHLWMVRLLLGVALLGALACAGRRQDGVIVTIAGLLLASLAFTGHAAMHSGVQGWLHRLNHAVHLLCGAFWVGGLLPFVSCLPALRDPARQHDATAALRGFSRAGHLAVAGVLATGAANTALVLGRWPVDWTSSYEVLLDVKIALVAAMAVLALINRYVWVPRLCKTPDAAIRAIRHRAIAEIVLAAAVLALVAAFGILEPA